MKRYIYSGLRLSVVSFIALFNQTSAFAQSRPTTAGAEPLQAIITGVEGNVRVRQSEDQPWTKAEVGMKLNELAEFKTGVRSAVRFTIPPDQTITLDRLGEAKLLQAVNDNGKIKTTIGMTSGRTRFTIDAQGRPHEATIASPSSVLAVRGTDFSCFDQRPFPFEGVSLEGRVSMTTAKKQLQFGNKGQGKTTVDSNSDSTAALALSNATLDPSLSLARSAAEAPLIERVISNGSTVFFDRDAGIKVVKGGTPPNDRQLLPALPGVLNVVARWHTDADLNLSLSTPGGPKGGGEILYPIGALSTNSSGGHVAFDHRGGPNGGIEVIYFDKVPADGLYAIGLTLASGPATQANVDAFLNGKRVGIFDGHSTVQSITTTVPVPTGQVQGTAVGILPVGFKFPFASPSAVANTKTVSQLQKTPAKISQITTPVAPIKQKR